MEELSEEEIAKRLPVWVVLADTFLDTWFDPEQYDRMAARLALSGYSIEELEWIYRNEVAPAFIFNLFDVAGEWAGWPDDFIRERVLSKRGSVLSKIAERVFLSDYVDKEWAKFLSRLNV